MLDPSASLGVLAGVGVGVGVRSGRLRVRSGAGLCVAAVRRAVSGGGSVGAVVCAGSATFGVSSTGATDCSDKVGAINNSATTPACKAAATISPALSSLFRAIASPIRL